MKKKWIIFSLVGLAIISWLPYQYKKQQTERAFAEYLLIRETGIYTLLGSKPITSVLLSYKQVNNSKPAEPTPIFGLQFTKSNHFKKELPDLWKHWKKRRPINSSHFSLVTIREKSSEDLCLVNKNLVRAALQEYYSKIAEHLGEDFNIDDVINTIDEPDSYFWTKIFKHHLACGIFYGYGIENSEKFKIDTSNAKFSNSIKDLLNARFKKNISLSDLPLPMFKSFSDPDPMIAKYKTERQQIQDKYQYANLRKLLTEALR